MSRFLSTPRIEYNLLPAHARAITRYAAGGPCPAWMQGIERYPVPGGWMVKVRRSRKLILEFFRDSDWSHTMKPLHHAAFAALCLRNAICGPVPMATASLREPRDGMVGRYRAPAFRVRPVSAPHNGRAAWDRFTRAAGRQPDRIVWDQAGKQWLAYFPKESPWAIRRGETKPRKLSR